MPSVFCCAWRPHRFTDEDSPLRSTQLCSRWAVNMERASSTTTNSLPCHFVASWRLNYIIHTSTLVSVNTVRVGEHNCIVIIIIIRASDRDLWRIFGDCLSTHATTATVCGRRFQTLFNLWLLTLLPRSLTLRPLNGVTGQSVLEFSRNGGIRQSKVGRISRDLFKATRPEESNVSTVHIRLCVTR